MQVIPNNNQDRQQQPPSQQEYYEDEMSQEEAIYQQQMQQQQMQQQNLYGHPSFPSQDKGFLRWLLDFRKEAVEPLRHVWRGEEYDFDNHVWIQSKTKYQMMNEFGIMWGISLIESYMSPVFLSTELDERTYCHLMREASRTIYNGMATQWREFGISAKTDIMRIGNEIESKICAILRGALNDGYRDFFSTTSQNTEIKNLTPNEPQSRPGVFSSMANFFRKNNNSGGYQ